MLSWKNVIRTGQNTRNFPRRPYRVPLVLRIFLPAVFLYYSAVAAAQPMHSISKVYVFRLRPHEDLKRSVFQFAKDHGIKAGIILTCVGSLEQVNLRFAN